PALRAVGDPTSRGRGAGRRPAAWAPAVRRRSLAARGHPPRPARAAVPADLDRGRARKRGSVGAHACGARRLPRRRAARVPITRTVAMRSPLRVAYPLVNIAGFGNNVITLAKAHCVAERCGLTYLPPRWPPTHHMPQSRDGYGHYFPLRARDRLVHTCLRIS